MKKRGLSLLLNIFLVTVFCFILVVVAYSYQNHSSNVANDSELVTNEQSGSEVVQYTQLVDEVEHQIDVADIEGKLEEVDIEEFGEVIGEEAEVNYKTAHDWVVENSELFSASIVKTCGNNYGLSRALYMFGNELYELEDEIIIDEAELEREVPLFFQWDDRWAYEPFCGDMIATSGCGPTCMAMVAVGLLQDTSINPKTAAEFATENGFAQNGVGTKWAFFPTYAKAYGLNCRTIGKSYNSILSELEKGNYVICSVRKGHFTYGGHFIVLTGIDDDGKIKVNDPMSVARSAATWNYDEFKTEIKSSWSFSYDE